jgi:hypothetical protein
MRTTSLLLSAIAGCALSLAGCGPTRIDAVGLTPTTLGTGLLAHWTFDQTEGTTLEDDSGNRRSGIVSGATWVKDGQFNGALHFEKGDTVTVDRFPDPGTNWSFSAWIRISEEDAANDELGTAISTETYQQGGWEFQTYGRSSGVYWHFGYLIESPSKYAHYECKPFDVGRWSHATVVVDAAASLLSFYVDAELVEPRSTWVPFLPGSPTLFMGRWTGAGRPFVGSLDDVAIYGRALSAAEVAELHRTPAPRPQ